MAERVLTVKIVGNASSLQREFRRSSAAAGTFDRSLGRATRGALAGSGVFRGLGRSIAFASGGFLAFASAGQFLRTSIDAAKDAAVTQKQLAAQFRASGVDLGKYQGQIDKTANRLSLLAGIENDELKAGFTTIFRTTGDVNKSLRDLATATDLARAKHLAFAQAALIVAKTEAGNTTLLRRQGFQIAKNATAEQALATLRRVVAGQARAGTTAQERFGAVLHNTEEIIGGALLPVLNKYLTRASVWLTQMNESGRLQKDVNDAVRTAGEVFAGLRSILSPIIALFRGLGKAVGGTKHEVELLAGAFLLLKTRAALLGLGLIGGGMRGIGTAAEASAIKVGLLSRAVQTLGKSWLFAGAALEAYAFSKTITTPQPVKVAPSPSTGPLHQGDIVVSNGRFYIQTPGGRLTPFNGPPPITATTPIVRRGIDAPTRFQPHVAAAAATAGARARRGVSLQGQFNIAELRLAKAQLTATAADDRKILITEAGITQQQIKQAKTLKEKTRLTQQLAGITDQIRNIDQASSDATKKSADAAKKRAAAAKKTRETIGAFAVSLTLQVAQARLEALGKDTKPILQKIRQAAQTALKSGRLGLQGQLDAWNAIRDVNEQLKTATTKAAGEFRRSNFAQLIAAINLTAAEKKSLEARLSQVGANGTVPRRGVGVFGVPVAAGATPLVVHTHVNLDGRQVAINTTRHQQRRKIRNPDQRRGMFGGGGL